MPELRSGLVFAAGYADKLRRTIFAQLREQVKKDKELAKQVALYVGRLNRALYTLLVEELKVDKFDVVRITISYELDEVNKAIVWKWDTLKVEIYKRIPPETYEEALKKFVARAPTLAVEVVKYNVSKIGETFDGDLIYSIKIDEKEVGVVEVLPVEDIVVLKKAAVIEPVTAIFEKAKIELKGRPIEDALVEQLSKIMEIARHVDTGEALQVINAIRGRLQIAPLEKPVEMEEAE
ncbi:MAG: DUF2258 domain-containing protein [Desulfurococcaceae archaeon]|jgi:hypothetical protein|nr:DUF2258 domain-containing protein [Desulfurococcaceae archaeon]